MPAPVDLAHELEAVSRTCRAIVETPRDSRAKFHYDPKTGLYELGKELPAGLCFPFAFGFIPSTKADDGDPLDVIILSDANLPVGCLVRIRLLGVMEAEQRGPNADRPSRWIQNHRLFARPVESPVRADVNELAQLGGSFLDEASRYFATYKELRGQEFRVTSIEGSSRAVALIERAART